MKFTQQKKAQFVASLIRNSYKIVIVGINVTLLYFYVTAQKRGRERALQYQRVHGKKKQTPLLSSQLQPQYIQKQKRKYRALISQKKDQK